MAIQAHINKLKQGVEAWNQWRQENWNIRPDLSGIDLTKGNGIRRSSLWDSRARRVNYSGINFSGADLSGSKLAKAIMSNATIVESDLTGCDLQGADLSSTDLRGSYLNKARLIAAKCSDASFVNCDLRKADLWTADLRGCDFESANLEHANFNKADLHGASFSQANLYYTDIRAANLRAVNFDRAGVIGVKYERGSMRGRYQGIRGIETTYGDAIFRRDALDQDYIDTLALRWRFTPRYLMHWVWSLIDYGRSLTRIVVLALLIILGFGLAFDLNPQWIEANVNIDEQFRPYAASAIAFTYLGFSSNVSSANAMGQFILSAEAVLGYLTFALFISVLLLKISRRS